MRYSETKLRNASATAREIDEPGIDVFMHRAVDFASMTGPFDNGALTLAHTLAAPADVRVAFVGEMVLLRDKQRLTAVRAATAELAYVVDGVDAAWPSPDGVTLALLHADGALVLHDGRTGASLRTLTLDLGDGNDESKNASNEPRALLFSPHGGRVAVAAGTQLVVFEVGSAAVVRTFAIDDDRRAEPLAFSGDDALLAFARAPHGSAVHALHDGSVVATFERELVVCLSHNGDRAVTTSNYAQTFLRHRHPARTVKIEAGWSPSSGVVGWGAFPLPGARAGARALRIGTWLFDEDTGAPSGSLAVPEPHDAAFAALGIKRHYTATPRAVSVSRDGAVAVVADARGVHAWDVAARRLVGSLWPHFGIFERLALSPDGTYLVTVARNHVEPVKVWRVDVDVDVDASAAPRENDGHASPSVSLSLTTRQQADIDPGEPCMDCCSDWVGDAELVEDARAALLQPTHEHDSCAPVGAGPILDWLHRFKLDIESGALQRVDDTLSHVQPPSYPPRPTTLRSEHHVVEGCLDGRVRISKSDGTLVAESHGHRESITKLRVSPDGQWLASGGRDGAVLLHRLSDGALMQRVAGPFLVEALAWSPDSSCLVVIANDARMTILALDGAVRVRQTVTFDAHRVVRFWPDAAHVVAGGALYRVSDGMPVACLTTDAKQSVLAAAPTADGALRVVVTPGGLHVDVLESTCVGRAVAVRA